MTAYGQTGSPFLSANKRHENGFTLIELLVVTTMIAIMAALALMSFGLIGNDRDVQDQVARLSAIIEMSSEEAQMQGRDFGLEFVRSGYRFVEYDELLDVWSEVIGDDILGPRDLGETMEFELKLEDRIILLPAEAKSTGSDDNDDDDEDDERRDSDRDLTDDYLPHVLLLSSGDITPFEIMIVRDFDNVSAGLIVDAAGKLEMTSDDQDL